MESIDGLNDFQPNIKRLSAIEFYNRYAIIAQFVGDGKEGLLIDTRSDASTYPRGFFECHTVDSLKEKVQTVESVKQLPVLLITDDNNEDWSVKTLSNLPSFVSEILLLKDFPEFHQLFSRLFTPGLKYVTPVVLRIGPSLFCFWCPWNVAKTPGPWLAGIEGVVDFSVNPIVREEGPKRCHVSPDPQLRLIGEAGKKDILPSPASIICAAERLTAKAKWMIVSSDNDILSACVLVFVCCRKLDCSPEVASVILQRRLGLELRWPARILSSIREALIADL